MPRGPGPCTLSRRLAVRLFRPLDYRRDQGLEQDAGAVIVVAGEDVILAGGRLARPRPQGLAVADHDEVQARDHEHDLIAGPQTASFGRCLYRPALLVHHPMPQWPGNPASRVTSRTASLLR